MCNAGCTKNSNLSTYVGNIWLLTSIYDTHIAVKHIAGKNVLSRWEDKSPSHISKHSQLVPGYE